jgi:hypothetical protein
VSDTSARESLSAARRSIACLAVEVPGEVWDDVNAKTAAVFGAYERLAHALKDILDVAEREIAGFPIEREEWYARRDYARIQLEESGV